MEVDWNEPLPEDVTKNDQPKMSDVKCANVYIAVGHSFCCYFVGSRLDNL